MTNDEALTLEALKYAASKGHGPLLREMKIAPFTIKEAQAQPVQEPVATMKMLHTYGDTTSPQRPWVGLSDSQIEQVYYDVAKLHRGAPMPWGQVQFGNALQALVKEKNNG